MLNHPELTAIEVASDESRRKKAKWASINLASSRIYQNSGNFAGTNRAISFPTEEMEKIGIATLKVSLAAWDISQKGMSP